VRTVSKAGILTLIGSGLLVLGVSGCGSGGSQVSGSSALPASALGRNPTYHGGPLLQRVRVATLFWGQGPDPSGVFGYFNRFFEALFADGRYMANLSQYSAGGYRIGNGELVATDSDSVAPPARVTDAQIQAEISAQLSARKLPAPEADTLYVVFIPPNVLVVDPDGIESDHNFSGYHTYSHAGGFAYAVVLSGSRDEMTIIASHELAEAVTDPQSDSWATVGWIDDRYGEIGDIPQDLYAAGRIGKEQYRDVLVGPDGTRYLVQKVWSVKDGAPAAFRFTGSRQRPSAQAMANQIAASGRLPQARSAAIPASNDAASSRPPATIGSRAPSRMPARFSR
jgi:hypothetical protein